MVLERRTSKCLIYSFYGLWTDILSLAIAAILSNYFCSVLGCCSFFGVSKKTDTALGMGMAVIFVMAIASSIPGPGQYFILEPWVWGYADHRVHSRNCNAGSVRRDVHEEGYAVAVPAPGIFLPLITTNCAARCRYTNISK